MKGKCELDKMFDAVVADYRESWREAEPPTRKASVTSSPHRSTSAVSNAMVEEGDAALTGTEPNPE